MGEDDFIAALEHIDRAGDVPGRGDAPAACAMRHRAVRENAAAWDESRGRYVLTGTGRSRIAGRRAAAGREPQTAEVHVLRARPRDAARGTN